MTPTISDGVLDVQRPEVLVRLNPRVSCVQFTG
jgi:hypothetical protein